MTALIAVILYLLFSLYVSRKIASQMQTGLAADKANRFFIGGRILNGPLLALTLVATYTSASSFIGGPGAAYKIGLGWVWLALIQVPVAMLTLGVLGPKFLALKERHATLLEWLTHRFNNPYLSGLAIVSLVAGFIAMITVQFIGGARMFAGVSGISYELGLAIFVVTVLAYTLTGGFRAVAATDAVQGIVMVLGIIILLITLLVKGDVPAMLAKLNAEHSPLLSPWGSEQQLGWPMMLSFWVLVCFGTLGLPHTVVRLLAVKDKQALRTGMIYGTAISLLMTLLPHLCGFFGRAIYPDLTVPDQIMPNLISGLFSPWVAGLLLAAPIAAVMSSVDSMLLQSAVTLVRDAVVNVRPQLSSQHQLSLTRVAMLCITLLAAWWALKPPDMIVWLNLAAFGALQSVFLWPVVAGIFWPAISGEAALAAMLTGLASYLLAFTSGPLPYHIHAIVPALIMSLLSMLLVVAIQSYRHKHCSVTDGDN
ncbi:sodium/pantothenate symporter [Shewanella sp. NIFS-20-20]|uniref:sodium/pantothenate symporter n=1 Tax=Shewanella sp. NIFS-20-20 TaxID=2853806 RepID=UPI001C43B5A9|nr:sodium/pantothenate symporter [Shewanella sp. NIFS-20-20]MBV7315550.1 sodium/pantothenate symporter [Shewanella sp. NIFS-20-20]